MKLNFNFAVAIILFAIAGVFFMAPVNSENAEQISSLIGIVAAVIAIYSVLIGITSEIHLTRKIILASIEMSKQSMLLSSFKIMKQISSAEYDRLKLKEVELGFLTREEVEEYIEQKRQDVHKLKELVRELEQSAQESN